MQCELTGNTGTTSICELSSKLGNWGSLPYQEIRTIGFFGATSRTEMGRPKLSARVFKNATQPSGEHKAIRYKLYVKDSHSVLTLTEDNGVDTMSLSLFNVCLKLEGATCTVKRPQETEVR